MQKLYLKSVLSPGDAVVMTAAVKSLHSTYPGEYSTDVETSAMEVWENNPYRVRLVGETDIQRCDLHYSLVNLSNQRANSFMQAYVDGLSKIIQRPLQLTTNRPDLYISEDEKKWMDHVQHHKTGGRKVPFWLINTGVKKDYTTKQWPVEFYQKVVDQTAGLIQWVQVGANEHEHHPLSGVINVVGQTNQREFIRLVYHSKGGLGPSTYLQHLCAAFEKQYICILGGREPVPWVTYPRQTTLHTIGQLDCCKNGACWKSRVVPLEDGDPKDESLCSVPILGYIKPVGKCMAIIRPEEVVMILSRIYNQAL